MSSMLGRSTDFYSVEQSARSRAAAARSRLASIHCVIHFGLAHKLLLSQSCSTQLRQYVAVSRRHNYCVIPIGSAHTFSFNQAARGLRQHVIAPPLVCCSEASLLASSMSDRRSECYSVKQATLRLQHHVAAARRYNHDVIHFGSAYTS